MNATTLKIYVQGSRLLLRWYGLLLTARADVAAARGDEHGALYYLLRAHRIVPEELLPARGRRALRALLVRLGLAGEDVRPSAENRVLAAFVSSAEGRTVHLEWTGRPLHHRVRLRVPRDPDSSERQGNLIIIKDAAPGEKGVLLIKYNKAMRQCAAVFDLPRLLADYMIVLEPSSGGYQDSTFLLYAGSDAQVLVQSPRGEDFDFIASLGNGLVPVRVGAGDWVDPEVFRPSAGERRFGAAMVSMWDPLKRHHVLFRAMKTLRQRGTDVTVALVGYPARWRLDDVKRLADSWGVGDLCTFFERIPHEEVAAVLAQSSAYVLLSRREGANKSLYESLFSDTPVIVPAGHVGVNLDHVTPETGVILRDDGDLADLLDQVIRNPDRFSPRKWALENTGATRSTAVLNTILAQMAHERGQAWTRDIVVKVNAPNLQYQKADDRLALQPAYARLERFLRP